MKPLNEDSNEVILITHYLQGTLKLTVDGYMLCQYIVSIAVSLGGYVIDAFPPPPLAPLLTQLF